jgi:zinc/manganese transport system permease protein
MNSLLSLLFAPGFFASEPVRIAAVIGAAAAIVSGVVGVFAVIRGQSFAGHSLADVSSAGGSAAFLFGINPLLGFLAMGVLAATGMEVVRADRASERDLVTGVVTGAGLGLAALFLYLDMTTSTTTGAAVTVMFGSIFAIPASLIPPALIVGAGALLAVGVLYRPLLLSSLDPDLASVRGVPVRLTGFLFLLVVALAVSLSAMTVGAILSTGLLIGPAAIALHLAKRPGLATLLAAAIGVAATWGGILIAYDSYRWTGGHGWPVSFCIVALIFVAYLVVAQTVVVARTGPGWGRRRERQPPGAATPRATKAG